MLVALSRLLRASSNTISRSQQSIMNPCTFLTESSVFVPKISAPCRAVHAAAFGTFSSSPSAVLRPPLTQQGHRLHRNRCGALHQDYGWQQLRPQIRWQGLSSTRQEEEDESKCVLAANRLITCSPLRCLLGIFLAGKSRLRSLSLNYNCQIIG